MAYSINDIQQKLAQQRAQQLAQQRSQEQRLLQEREAQRQAYLNNMRLYETSMAITNSSSSGAGGGRISTNTIEPTIPTIVETLQCTIMTFLDDSNNFQYFIANHTDQTSTGVLPLNINNDYALDQEIGVSNKGFVLIFSGPTTRIFIIDTNGSILLEKDIVSDDGFSDYFDNSVATIKYDLDGVYYLISYNGVVSEYTFDNTFNLNSNFDDNFKSGLVVSEDTGSGTKFWIVKHGNEKVEIFYVENDYSSVTYTYSLSNSVVLAIRDINTSMLLGLKIFNELGQLIYEFDVTTISSNISSYDINFLNSLGSFVLLADDDVTNTKHIIYYSAESITITNLQLDKTLYTNYITDTSIRSDYSIRNYVYESHSYIFYSGYTETNSYAYPDDCIILPIFSGQESIGSFYTFCTPSDSRSKGFALNWSKTRTYDKLNIFVDLSDTDHKILSFNRDGSNSILNTGIDLTNIQDNSSRMMNRIFITTFNTNYKTYLVDHDGLVTVGPELVDVSYQNRRNSLFLYDSTQELSWYTNTTTGNSFVQLGYYFNSIENTQSVANDYGERVGNMFLYNDINDGKIGTILTDTTISSTFSYNLISSNIDKHSFYMGETFLAVHNSIEPSDGTPYTHTQLGFSPGTPNSVDYPMDGSTQSGDGVFGTGSTYFTNMYPGLFTLVAENLDINTFRIDGNNGADGSGTVDTYVYNTSYLGNDYTAYVKRIYNSGDPSINQIIIVDSDGMGITHTVSSNTDNDVSSLTGLSDINKLYYLLLSKTPGSTLGLSNTEIENIVDEYITNIDGQNIDSVLTYINTNYSTITSLISDIYYFSDQGNIDNIGDGGNDMYDGGNKFYTGSITTSAIGFYDLMGNLLDTLEGGYDLYVDNHWGEKIFGFYQDNIWLFFNNELIITDVQSNDFDYEFNDFIWWDD